MGVNCTKCLCVNQYTNEHNGNCSSRPLISLNKSNDNTFINKSNGDDDKELSKECLLIKLTAVIKGFLYRERFQREIHLLLGKFTEEIYNTFINKIAHNNAVEEILSKYDVNKIYNVKGWKSYYENNPFPQQRNNNGNCSCKYSNIIFHNKILITYISHSQSPYETKEDIVNHISSLYFGDLDINSAKQGKGRLTFKDGTIYHGTWDSNRFMGWNLSISSRGVIYIGEFSDFSLTGKGERYTIENHIYKGDFVSGLREGQGIESTEHSIYVGGYKEDKQYGKAKVTFSSGDVYEGEIANGVFHGNGHYVWKKSGNEYIGMYKNGKFDGEGIYKMKNGEYYKGEYEDGIKEGKGEMHFIDGKKYIGQFSRGKPHGVGYYDDGCGFKGNVEFIFGKINKKG